MEVASGQERLEQSGMDQRFAKAASLLKRFSFMRAELTQLEEKYLKEASSLRFDLDQPENRNSTCEDRRLRLARINEVLGIIRTLYNLQMPKAEEHTYMKENKREFAQENTAYSRERAGWGTELVFRANPYIAYQKALTILLEDLDKIYTKNDLLMEDPKMDVAALAQKLGIDFTRLTPEETRQFALNLERLAEQAKKMGETHFQPEPFIGRDAAWDAANKIAEKTRARIQNERTSPR